MSDNQVFISGLGYYPNPLVPELEQAEVFLEHIKKIIRAAKLLGIPVVNTFIGRDQNLTIEDNLKLFADRWPPIIKFAEEKQYQGCY